MPDKIHLTVGVVCEKGGKLLMVHEVDGGKSVINQPAGHVEPGETFKAAALRETLEETGYMVVLESVLGFSAYPAANGIMYYRASFLASCPDQVPSADIDSDIDQVSWMFPQEILESENQRSMLVAMDVNRYLSGVRYPLEMISEKA